MNEIIKIPTMNSENPEATLMKEFEAAADASDLADDMGLTEEEKAKVELKMDKETLYAKIKSTGEIRKFYFAGAGPAFIAKQIRRELES